MSKTNPLVSIVTPVYNEEEFLRYTLESVKEQNYDKIEHIVINDGSTDNTSSILEEYKDRYNLRIFDQSNMGRPAAMNKGFKNVTGDIVFWLNGDDVIYHKDTISNVVNEFNSRPDADIIYGNRAIIDENNSLNRIVINTPFFSQARLFRNCFAAFNFMRSEIVKEHKMDTEYQLALDYDYYLMLASEGFNFHHMNSILYCYRQHEDTTSSNLEDRLKEGEKIKDSYRGKVERKKGMARVIDRSSLKIENTLLQIFIMQDLIHLYFNNNEIAFPMRVDSMSKVCLRSMLPY